MDVSPLEDRCSDLSSFGAGYGVPFFIQDSGVDGELGTIRVCFDVGCFADPDVICHFIGCAGSDTGCAPAADGCDVTAGDGDCGVGVSEIFAAAGTGSLESGSDSCSTLHLFFGAGCTLGKDRSAADVDVYLIGSYAAADACSALDASCGNDSSAADRNICLIDGCFTDSSAGFSVLRSVGRSTGTDSGCSVAACGFNGTAGDLDLTISQVAAADPGPTVVGIALAASTDGFDGSPGDLDDRIGVHSAADPGPNISSNGFDIPTVDLNICEVVSRAFRIVRSGFAASYSVADPGISSGVNVPAVDDDLAAVGVVAAADAGAIAIGSGDDISSVEGDGSPLIFHVFVGSGGSSVHRVVRSPDPGSSAI